MGVKGTWLSLTGTPSLKADVQPQPNLRGPKGSEEGSREDWDATGNLREETADLGLEGRGRKLLPLTGEGAPARAKRGARGQRHRVQEGGLGGRNAGMCPVGKCGRWATNEPERRIGVGPGRTLDFIHSFINHSFIDNTQHSLLQRLL